MLWSQAPERYLGDESRGTAKAYICSGLPGSFSLLGSGLEGSKGFLWVLG
jgi:hypothetical protein